MLNTSHLPIQTRHSTEVHVLGRKFTVMYEYFYDDRLLLSVRYSDSLEPIPLYMLLKVKEKMAYEDWQQACKDKDDRDDYNAEVAGLSRSGQPRRRKA